MRPNEVGGMTEALNNIVSLHTPPDGTMAANSKYFWHSSLQSNSQKTPTVAPTIQKI